MAAAPQLRDRLSFLHRLPILLKGTADDAAPCPGYLFEEIAKISHESLGSSQCLLEYLLGRLHSTSGHVKLKVLKILRYLCGHGSASFLLILRQNAALVQEATAFSGPPDPLHGNSLYQKVRAAAQDLGSTLFTDATLPLPSSQPPRTLPPAGMGSQSRLDGTLQGFGYSQDGGQSGSAGKALLSTIQKAAEVVANAVRPGPEDPATHRPLLQDDTYQPAQTPGASHSCSVPGSCGAIPAARDARHQPGQAGGGWDDLDSSLSPQSSSPGSSGSRTSDLGSRSGSDSHSGASREFGELAERAEAVAPSDCQQELSLVRRLTQGSCAFLSPNEVQCFLKECGLLNCEVVLELLAGQLRGAGECEQMRALGAIAALGHADLLPQELILALTRLRLQELSSGSPGPVTNKATKILRHLEASCGQRPPAPLPPAWPGPATTTAPDSSTDLLTTAVPPAVDQAFLQPLSPAPISPRSPVPTTVPGDIGQAETRPEQVTSLFAGMDLVACPSPRLAGPGPATEAPPTPCPGAQASQTLAQGAAGSGQSVFAFLNA
ncbi:AP-4 complex accessory subunit tepsin isoform X1 [Ochotona curzoniae]|uniref:AP-4 complex accessory subunit tepsin isoform X1 n=2 Tax=Ochotona curzoniae TaxID=130825 RepID=UPI001B34ACBF|nr:AP-4 complex accessory subunit tepsin isoform X1 [Ochotona curzoniae]